MKPSLNKKVKWSKKLAPVALALATMAGTTACESKMCLDQVACGNATRGVVMALPEFSIPSMDEILPEIELGAAQIRAALIRLGVPAAVIDSLGVDGSDVDAVVDALGDHGVSINVDGLIEELLIDILEQVEAEVNAQIAASLPEGGSAEVTLLGVEDLTVDLYPGDIDRSILAALDQLSMNAKLSLPIQSIEQMNGGEASGGIKAETITSILESVELSELGLRTLAPTEAPVTEVKLLNPASRMAALRSNCEAGQTQFDLLEKLKVQLKQDMSGAQNQTLFNYPGTVGSGHCGVVLQAKTPIDLLDALITGAQLSLDITTGFPLESARILPAAKVKFTGSLELPGTITSLMGAISK
jgi:hypothetical protein